MCLEEQKGFVYITYDRWLVSLLGLTEGARGFLTNATMYSFRVLQNRSQIRGEAKNFVTMENEGGCLYRGRGGLATTGRLLQVGAAAKWRHRHGWVTRWRPVLPSSKRGSWCPRAILVADSPGQSLTFSTVTAPGRPKALLLISKLGEMEATDLPNYASRQQLEEINQGGQHQSRSSGSATVMSDTLEWHKISFLKSYYFEWVLNARPAPGLGDGEGLCGRGVRKRWLTPHPHSHPHPHHDTPRWVGLVAKNNGRLWGTLESEMWKQFTFFAALNLVFSKRGLECMFSEP